MRRERSVGRPARRFVGRITGRLAISLALAQVITAAAGRAGEVAAVPAQAERTYQEGNAAYRAGRFQDAVRLYDRARGTGLSAPQLEYNRANALLKSGQLGRSIAGYERARRMGLDEPDVQASLRYARSLTRDARPPEETSKLAKFALEVVRRVSASTLFWIGWALLAGAAGLGALRLAGGRGTALRWAGVLLGAGLALQAGGVALGMRDRSDVRAVLLGQEVAVRSGPGTDFPAPFTLHEGTVVRVGRAAGPWREIELSADLAGWVQAGSLEVI
ncbi:MAG: SH3 domain-containing protein [Candidatus Eisenbacteria bacterium]|nr:SH3 domain-containing protein [Candidatus Eisenbacteria bacterium]